MAIPIWHPGVPSTSPYIFLKRRFVLAGDCLEAWLRCACNGPCEVYLNAQLAGRGLGPGLTEMPVWNICEIGSLLQAGENILLVLARAHPDPEQFAWFMAEGEITCKDGSRVWLGSDTGWQVLQDDSRRILAADSPTESYIAGYPSWREGHFRAASWAPAAVVPGSCEAPRFWAPHPVIEEEVWGREVIEFGEIEAAGPLCFVDNPDRMEQCKCVHREALLQQGKTRALVQTRSAERAVYLVLDFGRIVSGFPRLRLHGTAPGVVDMGFARNRGEIESGLRYVCAPVEQEWTDVQMRTCRYLVLRFAQCAESLEMDSVSMLERRFEVEYKGDFSSSESLEHIWGIGPFNLQACRQEAYWQSPGEPSYDWLRAYTLALGDYYLSGDSRTAAATLACARLPHPSASEMPQALAYVLFLETFHQYCGSSAELEELLPGALQLLDSCLGQQDGEGLLSAAGTTWSSTALNALYAGALQAGGRLCAAIGNRKERVRYRQEGHEVQRALRGFWSAERGLFVEGKGSAREDSSQWSNALVLYFGLADSGQQEQIVQRISGADTKRVDGLLEAFFLVGGLWRAGAGERALNYLQRQWGKLVERPGRTWGEKMRSQGAAVEPGPEYYLGSHILGVRPGAPGYRIVEIWPQPAGLLQGRGCLPTRRGAVQVEWDAAVSFALRVECEEEGETHLGVPRLGKRFPTLSLNGTTVWRNEKFYPNPFVQEIVHVGDRIVLVVQGTGPHEVLVD